MRSAGDKVVEVTVRYFAAARDGAGRNAEVLTLPNETSVHELLQLLSASYGSELGSVLACSSFFLDGLIVREPHKHVLTKAATFDILPPFAGG